MRKIILSSLVFFIVIGCVTAQPCYSSVYYVAPNVSCDGLFRSDRAFPEKTPVPDAAADISGPRHQRSIDRSPERTDCQAPPREANDNVRAIMPENFCILDLILSWALTQRCL